MTTPSDEALAAVAAAAKPLRQVRAFTEWVGAGRKLTQKGRITLTDARELVGLLGTADEIDPMIGDRVFRTRSSEELPGVTTIAGWAKASGLLRVTGGRLVQVKKNSGLLQRPLELWTRMFEAFPRLGEALCASGWGASLLRENFEAGIGAVLAAMAHRGGVIAPAEAGSLAWETVAAGYVLDDLTDQQLATWRELTDRDLRHALDVLQQLGAVRPGDAGGVELTELAQWALGRGSDTPAPGDPVFRVKLSLAEVADPPVWRRLLVPTAIRLDRLHQVIQAAMGWEDYHLHAFSDGRVRYGPPDRELRLRDEREATLGDLIPRRGGRARYTYDFGDDWIHELVVEERLAAEPGTAYPVCEAGEGACPPEDCGGPWGYEHLREVLADPTSDEHEDMLEWLGLEKGTDFDPHRFDLNDVNRALGGVDGRRAVHSP
jgi:Plasmid pRiA4b ORF-3-like protein